MGVGGYAPGASWAQAHGMGRACGGQTQSMQTGCTDQAQGMGLATYRIRRMHTDTCRGKAAGEGEGEGQSPFETDGGATPPLGRPYPVLRRGPAQERGMRESHCDPAAKHTLERRMGGRGGRG